jgi:hypothetical protein
VAPAWRATGSRRPRWKAGPHIRRGIWGGSWRSTPSTAGLGSGPVVAGGGSTGHGGAAIAGLYGSLPPVGTPANGGTIRTPWVGLPTRCSPRRSTSGPPRSGTWSSTDGPSR